jgi:hypothetical protein
MSFIAFLVVGPVLLIVLTVYLHIFVNHHRRFKISDAVTQPMLPNFGNVSAKVATWLLFYWMVPITLAVFAWKSWPRPVAGISLLAGTLGLVVILGFLQARRCPKSWRRWAFPSLVLSFCLSLIISFELASSRQLDLFEADLSEKDLRGTNLSRANLFEANLSRAYLFGANLSRANLFEAKLSGANLFEAKLFRANLSEANLSGANLSRALLAEANLLGANLSRAYLFKTNLSRANLSGANLSEAKLSGAKLSGASHLIQEQLDEACGNDQTRLPRGLTIKPCEPSQ